MQQKIILTADGTAGSVAISVVVDQGKVNSGNKYLAESLERDLSAALLNYFRPSQIDINVFSQGSAKPRKPKKAKGKK